MDSQSNPVVKRRLFLINIVIIFTSIVGILSILEVVRGVGFHESNIQHLGLTSEFKERVSQLERGSKAELGEIHRLLGEIRKEPESCLSSINPILKFGLTMIKTQDIISICKEDIAILDKAAALIPMYEQGDISQLEFVSSLKKYGDTMHGHSFEFRPLVSKTVDVLLIIAGLILALKGLAVSIISIKSSRSIIEQFNSVANMEQKLRISNKELERSVTVLEDQKREIEETQKTAEYNALHDTLTTLPNRRYLDRYLSDAYQSKQPFAVLHIDIDGFKQINDTRGHHAGDFVLNVVADRLLKTVDASTFVARVGGDEFIIVVALNTEQEHNEKIDRIASQLVTEMQSPVKYQGFDCRFSISIGIAINGVLTSSADNNLLIEADFALYHQKLQGKNGFSYYDKALKKELTEKKELADQIHMALENNEFVPFYQPQFTSDKFELSGVETLVRWRHPERGILTPDKFLPLADEMGVLGEIDRSVFESAWNQFLQWESTGLVVPKLSVNVSLNSLLDPNLIDQLKQYEFEEGRIVFELLESILLDGCDPILQHAIDQLTQMGIELELDDFGTGHASILGLIALKPKRFKIDQQLITNLHKSEKQQALIRSIIDIGKSLNLGIIAEGVEFIEQAKILNELGCESLQGFYFTEPLSNDDFIAYIDILSCSMFSSKIAFYKRDSCS